MASGSRSDLKVLLILLAAGLVVAGIFALVGAPLVSEAAAVLAPGLGLKSAVPWGFGVTLAMFVLLALVAGDGLIGELQFMLSAFFVFFAGITLLIAWVF